MTFFVANCEQILTLSSEETSKIPMINENEVLKKYNFEVLEKIKVLKNDFFQTKEYDNFCINHDWNIFEQNSKKDFLKIHPNTCAEILNLLWWSYSYTIWKDGGI